MCLVYCKKSVLSGRLNSSLGRASEPSRWGRSFSLSDLVIWGLKTSCQSVWVLPEEGKDQTCLCRPEFAVCGGFWWDGTEVGAGCF